MTKEDVQSQARRDLANRLKEIKQPTTALVQQQKCSPADFEFKGSTDLTMHVSGIPIDGQRRPPPVPVAQPRSFYAQRGNKGGEPLSALTVRI